MIEQVYLELIDTLEEDKALYQDEERNEYAMLVPPRTHPFVNTIFTKYFIPNKNEHINLDIFGNVYYFSPKQTHDTHKDAAT